MVRSGRSAGLTPAPCAAANPGLASDETAAADAPRNPRRELVFDIVTSLVYCLGLQEIPFSYTVVQPSIPFAASAIVVGMRIRAMASRHSAFYSPLLCCLHFLKSEGHDVLYSVLGPGQRSYALIRDGEVDIMQSAVSSNWNALERGLEPLPVHFAQINQRDGFFLVGRLPDPAFDWKKLEGRTLLADHGAQPLAMLKYAVQHRGVEWKKIKVVDAGTPEGMASTFQGGKGDYVHLQAD